VADPLDAAKAAAARRAVERYVRPGARLALGTGSTAAHAVRAIREVYPGGVFDCVASSGATERLAASVGLGVRPLRGDDRFDLMLDGADEVSPALDLTKGGGGALLREKLLARLAARVVIVVDDSKLVRALGERRPVPVEVVPYCRPVLERELATLGFSPQLRRAPDVRPYRTENGNEILDLVPDEPIRQPAEVDRALRATVGVVETGLFVGIADRAVVGAPDGRVRELLRSREGERPAPEPG
jgi:ribose 5-phosphate isomerase A